MSSELTIFQPQNLDQAMRVSDVLAKSSVIPDSVRNKPGDVLAIIIKGQELGLTMMQALSGIHVIKGKTVMAADLQVAIVKRHRDCEFFRLVKSDDTIATYETKRRGEQPTTMSFTVEQAKQAQLSGDNWRKYPAAMLRARCSSALARAVYPDLMLGVYEEDEARSFAPDLKPSQPASEPFVQRTDEAKPAASRVDSVKAQVTRQLEAAGLTVTPAVDFRELAKRLGDAGKTGQAAADFIREVTGKATRADMTADDAAKVFDALDALAQPAGVEDATAPL